MLDRDLSRVHVSTADGREHCLLLEQRNGSLRIDGLRTTAAEDLEIGHLYDAIEAAIEAAVSGGVQITIVEHRAQPDGSASVYAYESNGQFFGHGGTVDDWRAWVSENRPTWPETIVAAEPPSLTVGPAPEYGERCLLCGAVKRDAYEYRLNAIALNAFGFAAPDRPPWCRLCNPDQEPRA
jgi:hypothetical protein